jgi:hypothetical protein
MLWRWVPGNIPEKWGFKHIDKGIKSTVPISSGCCRLVLLRPLIILNVCLYKVRLSRNIVNEAE